MNTFLRNILLLAGTWLKATWIIFLLKCSGDSPMWNICKSFRVSEKFPLIILFICLSNGQFPQWHALLQQITVLPWFPAVASHRGNKAFSAFFVSSYLSVFHAFCLPFCLSVSLFFFLSKSLCVYFNYFHVRLFASCLPVCLSVCLSVFL